MLEPNTQNQLNAISIPLNTIDDNLIVTLQGHIDENYLNQLGQDVSHVLSRGRHGKLIIDATALELIDLVDFRCLRQVIDIARLMGSSTIIAGLRPGVVFSLVELGAEIDGLITAHNLKTAIAKASGSQ